jgi:signal peptidase
MSSHRSVHRVLSHLVDVLLVIVVAVGLSGAVLGRLLPALGHPVYVVAGPSMAPAIGVGAAVILDRVPVAELAIGDVVSLQTGPTHAVYTHRIVRLVERDGARWLETRGDANATPDPVLIPATDVLGRVAWQVPDGGYLIALLSAPSGVILVLSTGALLLLLGWWLDALERDRREAARRVAATDLPRPSRKPVSSR